MGGGSSVGHGERTAPGRLIGSGKIVPMRLNLKIEDLPMATSAELYQLSWIIEQLLADPRRIVQARSQMHLGQQVQYFNWPDGKLRPGQVVSMKDSRVTVLDTQTKRQVVDDNYLGRRIDSAVLLLVLTCCLT